MADTRKFVIPISDAQRQRELEIAERIRAEEMESILRLLSSGLTPNQIQVALESASASAEARTSRQRHPDSPPVACKERCNWCCYQFVGVSAPEVFRILRYLASGLMESERTSLVQQVLRLDSITRGLTAKARASIPKPCAFLKDGRCSIYAVRPMACAEFTSYDALACKRGKRLGFKAGSIIHEKARMLVFKAVQRGFADALGHALPSADTAPLELMAGAACAMASQNAEESWAAGSSIFAGAHLVPGRQ